MTTAFWEFTINNYDETDLALVRQGYPDFVRQIVYTLERGEETGTPHIQAYLRLFRQQRLSYVRKLFPGASFKPLDADEYKLNAQRYAQKLDNTAESPAVISNNPFPDPVVELVSVIEEAFSSPDINEHFWSDPHLWYDGQPPRSTLLGWLEEVEFRRVRKTPRLAKFYVGATYRQVKDKFLDALKAHVFDLRKSEDTHTHTHTEEKFSRGGGITNEDHSVQDGSSPSEEFDEEEDCEDNDFGSGEEGETCSESDDSGRSESSFESED